MFRMGFYCGNHLSSLHEKMHSCVEDKLLESHPGIVKMKSMA